ncbi:hypothetical protein PVL30_000673 [Lodderomyces elongisporus]|uniref:uncharacterized protein n=1 Tax=Lodderomyces elongisporus TaxID=36914 RepID=UPI00291DC9E5|nr:uncharacterized protein PVL30_000673 [Lodderomyces elongisporus]WLF76966.1 hypothetical protein PVL30_000673 [Lodderomyces elongisporus]
MSELNLSPVELHNLRTSWSKTNQKEFFDKLYPNLLDQNRSLRRIFNNDDFVVKHHSEIFADCLQFVISNVQDASLVDEFLYQFVQENQRFASMAVQYLEPMGNAFITTFKQVLNTSWTSVLELVWIKVFVFIANSILGYEEDVKSETSSYNDAEIPPLNIQRGSSVSGAASSDKNVTPVMDSLPSPSTPATPVMDFDVTPQTVKTKNTSLLNKHNSIEIDLKANEKYKGFRRSQNVADAPVQVEIPKSPSFQKIHSNMSNNLKSFLSTPVEEDEEEEEERGGSGNVFASPRIPSFDPRKRSSTSRNGSTSTNNSNNSSDSTRNKSLPQTPKKSMSMVEDVDDELEEFATPKPSRRGSFSESYQPTSIFSRLQNQHPAMLAIADEDANEDAKSDDSIDAAPYDPRQRRRNNKNNNGATKVEIPSPESSEVDEQEEELFFNKTKQQQQQQQQHNVSAITSSVPERSLSRGGLTGGTFDYQSFGLKGLAPIVEDDDQSSKYESDGENRKLSVKRSGGSASSVGDSTDSRTSSLSLHNSDYKSSINSSVGPADSGIKGAGITQHQRQHMRNASGASDDFQFGAPAPPISQQQQQQQQQQAHKRKQSMYSLSKSCSASVSSINSTSRASLGFMRSSFVLKKEMEQQGYNYPENVMSVPGTPRMHSKTSMSAMNTPKPMYLAASRSTTSLRGVSGAGAGAGAGGFKSKSASAMSSQVFVDASDNASEMYSTFGSKLPMQRPVTASLVPSSLSTATEPAKKGFLQRITSMFSSKSSSSSPTSTPNASAAPSRKQSVANIVQNPYQDMASNENSFSHVPHPSASQINLAQTRKQQSSSLFAPQQQQMHQTQHRPTITSSATNLSSQTSTLAATSKPASSLFSSGATGRGGAASGYRYHGSSHDLHSVYSGDSASTGFTAMFKKHGGKNGAGGDNIKFVPPPTKHTRKGNKYNVKKVPYSTISLLK